MNIREATPADLDCVVTIAMDAAKAYAPKGLVLDIKGMRQCLVQSISSKASMVLMDDQGSMLVANGIPMVWANRKVVVLDLVVSKQVGAGRAMLCMFRQWCDRRMDFKLIHVTTGEEVDPRFELLLGRIGIKKSGSVYSHMRGG